MQNVQALRNHLDAHREASSLSIAYASLTEEGIAEVSKLIRDSPFVKYLDLRGNNVQAKGATILANGLRLNRSLRSLNLKWNAIGKDPAGISAMCDMLKTNLTIGHVDLRNNRVNNVGAKIIGEMLRANNTITHLDLSWNDLGVDGGLALLEGLKHNSTVIDCQLSGSKVGDETLHEVAFLLRKNKSAAAYRASPADTGAQAAAEDPVTATIAGGGPGSTIRSVPLSSTGMSQAKDNLGGTGVTPVATAVPQKTSLARAALGAKDSSSLLQRLQMKEREQVLPEDRLFYQQVAEHIDKLLLSTSKHKQGRIDGEEREKLSTTGFMEREQRYTKEIRLTEESLQKTIADKENLHRELAENSAELKRLNEEQTQSIRESVAVREQSTAEEQQLRQELRDIVTNKRELQDKLALSSKDLELLQEENERLRSHVKAFQRDVHEILV